MRLTGSDLLACERLLLPQIQTIQLLGQLPLTADDYTHLTTLIRARMRQDVGSGTRYITRWAPGCFAVFLVWTGITGYRAGNYWTAVHEALGTTEANWQSQWGQFFNRFLVRQQLPRFVIEGSPAYVTPILLHGLIPNICLNDYFSEVVRPLALRQRVYHPVEVSHELRLYRNDADRSEMLGNTLEQLQEQKQLFDRRLRQSYLLSQVHDEVKRLWQLEAPVAQLQLAQLPLLADEQAAMKPAAPSESEPERAIAALTQEWQDCQQVQARLMATIAVAAQDNRLLAQETALVTVLTATAQWPNLAAQVSALAERESVLAAQLQQQWSAYSTRPWQDAWGDLLAQWPLARMVQANFQANALAAVVEVATAQFAAAERANRNRRSQPPWWLGVGVVLLAALAALFFYWSPLTFWALVANVTHLAHTLFWPEFYVGAGVLCSGILLEIKRMQRLQQRHEQQLRRRAYLATVARCEDQQATLAGTWQVADLAPPWQREGMTLMPVYHALGQLYQQWARVRQERATQEQTWQQAYAAVAALATQVGLPHQEGEADLTGRLREALDTAQARRFAAAAAEERLTREIHPTVERLQVALRNAEEMAAAHKPWRAAEQALDQQLSRGSGDSGESQYATPQLESAARNEAAALRSELLRQHENLPKIEQLLRNTTKDGLALRRDAEEKLQAIKGIQARMAPIEEELQRYLLPWATLDEPVRRFLRFGGPVAEQLLIDTVLLLQGSVQAGEVVIPLEHTLPARLISAFEAWWAEQIWTCAATTTAPQLTRPAAFSEQFSQPMIELDRAKAALWVQFPPQQWQGGDTAAALQLTIADSAAPTREERYPLRAYRRQGPWVASTPLAIPLPFLADHYDVTLTQGDKCIQHWTMALWRADRPYLAFAWRSGQLIERAEIPIGQVWLLLPATARIAPERVIVEQVALHGHLAGYQLCGLDWAVADDVTVTAQGVVYPLLPATPARRMVVTLAGNQPLAAVRAAGLPLYVGTAPRLRIPQLEDNELAAWRLFIEEIVEPGPDAPVAETETGRFFQLDLLTDLLKRTPTEGWAELPLDHVRLLGPQAAGRFRIHLRKLPAENYEFTFALMPRLAISFPQTAYLPRQPEQQAAPIAVTIAASLRSRFVPQAPATLVQSRQGTHQVKSDFAAVAITGMLSLPSTGERMINVPLTISLPKVTWCLQGLTTEPALPWRDTVEELWLGDWEQRSALFLLVRVPVTITGTLELGPQGHTHGQRAAINDGEARFDLLALRAALRQDTPVQPLIVRHYAPAAAFQPQPLVAVRRHWEAADFQCIQRQRGRTVILQMRWRALGKATNPYVRIWGVNDTVSPCLEQTVDPQLATQANAEVEIVAPAAQLSPGIYLLQLVEVDPWVPADVSRPQPKDLNVMEITVVGAGNLRQGDIFTITGIRDDQGVRHPPDASYRIKVEGKIVNHKLPSRFRNQQVLITHGNEGWYVGRYIAEERAMHTLADQALHDEMLVSNPFKIEFNERTGEVTALEDRDGEGAMYCLQCRRLYWRAAALAAETAAGHDLSGPVELFTVRWDQGTDE